MLAADARVTVARLADRAAADIERLADRLALLIQDAEPDYALVPSAQLREDGRELVLQVLRELATGEPTSPHLAAPLARRRAEQGVSLGPMLHAFRLGFGVVWETLLTLATASGDESRLALLDRAQDVWAVVDGFSGSATTAYQEKLIELATRDAQRRMAALNAVLDGSLADWVRLSGSAAVIGLPSSVPYLVVAIAPESSTEPEPTPADILRRAGYPAALRNDLDGQWSGIVALGPGADTASLMSVVRTAWRGRTGISEAFVDLSDAHKARLEALNAAACIPPGEQGVMRCSDDPVAFLVTQLADPVVAVMQTLLKGVLNDPDGQILLETLATWFTCDGDTAKCARQLFCHRNTITRRLARVAELCGRDVKLPRSAAELYLALRVRQRR